MSGKAGQAENIALFAKISLSKQDVRVKSSRPRQSGCSSVVERDLAKVDVESSNLFTRSIFLKGLEGIPGLCYLQLSPIV